MNCSQVLLDDPPFYISDEYKQGDKIWENFRNLEDPGRKDRYIPRGSIVQVDEELYEQSDAPGHLVPIRVLNTPTTKSEEALKKTKSRSRDSLRTLVSGIKNKTRVKKDDTGWLNKNSIESAGKYTFAVKKDSQIYDNPNVHIDRKYFIKLKMESDKFVATNCCTEDVGPHDPVCVTKYKMTLMNEKGEDLNDDFINIKSCSFIDQLVPITNRNYESVREILNTLRNDTPSLSLTDLERLPPYQYWRGTNKSIIRSELIKMPIDKTGKGPFNSYHYRKDDKQNSDAYLKPKTMCVFNKVLEQWSKDCKEVGCQVQFGDLYHPPSWQAHSSHGSGECIDIRPMRANDDETLNGLKPGWERYSLDKTKRFVELLLKAGGKKLYFNDPKIYKNTKARYMKGHSDHIHVCFPEDDTDVKKVCNDGIQK
jgi:hypothetical protein